MNGVIRIGTRDSELALWQARNVAEALTKNGNRCELVPVKSTGDLVLDKPLYELGITGIFTKNLDISLLNHTIDIAVHSFKDVPTLLPKGLTRAAVLQRADPRDILIHKGTEFLKDQGVVATGSLRRKAQWLNHYPLHTITDLRGNVNTRLRKLNENAWNGAIFAAAGLERINLIPENYTYLDWMIPAPAQGAMMVCCRKDDTPRLQATAPLNDASTELCTLQEREFLKTLEGGCTAPIGCLVSQNGSHLILKGGIFSLDGKKKVVLEKSVELNKSQGFGKRCAEEILANGGAEIMSEIRKILDK